MKCCAATASQPPTLRGSNHNGEACITPCSHARVWASGKEQARRVRKEDVFEITNTMIGLKGYSRLLDA